MSPKIFYHLIFKTTFSHKQIDETGFFDWVRSKMGVASLVCGLENWLGHKNELMALTHFLHTDTNLGKLKFDSVIFGWMWWKMTMVF